MVASSPGSPIFSTFHELMLHTFQHATLKSWEGPGDRAKHGVHSHGLIQTYFSSEQFPILIM